MVFDLDGIIAPSAPFQRPLKALMGVFGGIIQGQGEFVSPRITPQTIKLNSDSPGQVP
jgi:hypothetical protein